MGKKGKKGGKRSPLATISTNTSGQSTGSSIKVDGGADLASLVQKIVPAPQANTAVANWEDDDEVIVIEKNPVIRKQKPAKVKEEISYAEYVGTYGHGVVTEFSTEKSWTKVKTINPASREEVTVLCVGTSDLKPGTLVDFQFSVYRGLLSAVNLKPTGTDGVISSVAELEVPVMNVEFTANIRAEDLSRIKAKSTDGRFVVLA